MGLSGPVHVEPGGRILGSSGPRALKNQDTLGCESTRRDQEGLENFVDYKTNLFEIRQSQTLQ